MTRAIYWATKEGCEREYTSPRPWSREFAAVLIRDGYEIVRLEFEWPDMASAVARARVVRAQATLSEADERAMLLDRNRALEDEVARLRAGQ